MRVLLVNDLAPGPGSGAEMHIARLADALARAGDAVDVFAGEIRHEGLRRLLDLWDPVARRALRVRVERFGPDVVHFHNVFNELSPAVLGATGEAASVLTVHDLRLAGMRTGPLAAHHPKEIIRGGKDRLARELARRLVDVVIAPAEHVAARLRATGFPRVHTVPGPPPSDRPPTSPGDDVVFAGRLSREKGVDTLIEAFSRVAADHPATRLVIAGDGPDRQRLETAAARLTRGRVSFTGPLDESGVRLAMDRARLVCVPSTVPEAAPAVIVEAAVAGRAVIASDGPAARELVGDDGLLVPAGDVCALAGALSTLLADRAMAAGLGAAARRKASQVSTATVVGRVRAVYEEAVARHG